MDQPLVFGKFDHLVGIENIVKSDHSLAMIMMTPGMLHNTGPFRMHVDIAQSLEKQGISSLPTALSNLYYSVYAVALMTAYKQH